jgi:hypothetical protein
MVIFLGILCLIVFCLPGIGQGSPVEKRWPWIVWKENRILRAREVARIAALKKKV